MKEPALVFKVIEEIVRAAIPMALIFGWVQWTPDQTGTVLIFVGVVVGGATLLLTRSQVVPTVVADKQIEIAKTASVNTPTEEIIKAAKESL